MSATPPKTRSDRLRIDYGKLMDRANYLYANAKLGSFANDPRNRAALPRIESDQVRAIAQALVEELNLARIVVHPADPV